MVNYEYSLFFLDYFKILLDCGYWVVLRVHVLGCKELIISLKKMDGSLSFVKLLTYGDLNILRRHLSIKTNKYLKL